jgi:deazaflavin-dependent oxidoreductase (nitroreductase family)
MKSQNFFMNVGNHFMKAILRSPFHGLASRSTMLVTFKGRKSGRQFTTPVNYVQEGQTLIVTSMKSRTWWKNLRGENELTILLRGKTVVAHGIVVEDEQGVEEGLNALLEKAPQYSTYFGVRLVEGKPNKEDILQESKRRVVIKLSMTG